MLYKIEELDVNGKGLHELISSMGVKSIGRGVVEHLHRPRVVNLYKSGDRTVAIGDNFSGYIEDVVEMDTFKLDAVDGSAFKAWSKAIEGKCVLYIDISGDVLSHISELNISRILESTCVWCEDEDEVVVGALLLETTTGTEAWELRPNYVDLYK